MDANGTRFHLLLGKEDWGRCLDERQRRLSVLWEADGEGVDEANLAWDADHYELTLQPRLFQFSPSTKDIPPKLTDRRGAGRDRYGNWYWIAESNQEILVNSAGTGVTSHFWSSGDGLACEQESFAGDFKPMEEPQTLAPFKLRGLAVTEDHYLVVGVLKPAGLLVFDLNSVGQPRQLLWPSEIDFAPFDMAAKPGGGVWILDCEINSPPHRARYWALDRHFNVIARDQQEAVLIAEQADDFQPKGGGEERSTRRRTFPRGIELEDSMPVAAHDPIAIEALPDGTVLILDRNAGASFSLIYRYDFGKPLGTPVSLQVTAKLVERSRRAAFTLIAHDFAFVPEHDGLEGKLADRLYVAAADGNQTYAFDVTQEQGQLRLEPRREYFPMRLFGGKALLTAGTEPYYDSGGDWIPLTEQRRPRYVQEATLETPLNEARFDSGEPDAVWHRLMIDACLPPETKVEVWSRAANEVRELGFTDWRREPDLYLRGNGSEQPFAPRRRAESAQTNAQINARQSGAGRGTWELLFQRARGRFLQLRLRLTGDGRTTPRLGALRAYYPRFSYLVHYLPGVYREDEQSASFLDRFLANFEGLYTSLEDRIAAVQLLFDVRSAPQETLDWLASWFEVALDPTWDERRRRLFIKHAMDFFQYRGTIRGLQMALKLALDPCVAEEVFTAPASGHSRPGDIRIVEKYRTRRTPGVVLGDPSDAGVGLSSVAQTGAWRPEQKSDELHRRYTEALQLVPPQPFSLHNPGGEQSSTWTEFSQKTLGFVPAVSAAERKRWQGYLASRYTNISALNLKHATTWTTFASITLPLDMPTGSAYLKDWLGFVKEPVSATTINRKRWQDFLARRYKTIVALNKAYKTNWTAFEVVALPDDLPPDGAPLLDWYQFESVIVPMQATAHRFTVMLPMPKSETPYSDEHHRRIEIATRIVNLEKPAHTVFDVKFFWAMFRIGEARLGDDTLLDRGSRAPELMPPLILGRNHLAESYIAAEQSAGSCPCPPVRSLR
jgi:phage tail-like protein